LKIIPTSFYDMDTVKVARELLGKTLIRRIGSKKITGTIIETEAYRYKDDPASHAFGGKTERNKIMFNEVGRAYVYFTYGMHYCFNVVARCSKCKAGAVLIRALKPLEGIEFMIKNRGIDSIKNLTNGPGKLTQALKINKKHYGADLSKFSSLFITYALEPKKTSASSRVGIKKGTGKPWNFKLIS